MNIKDYFNQQKDTHISDAQKMNVYQDFMVKKMKGHFHKKRSLLHVKSFVYSLAVMFFLFSFYGTYFFTDRYTEYEGLIMGPTNAVQADYIAKVVEFNGSFHIEHEGKRVQTSHIQDGDIVTLKENAQLVFHINDATKTKLIGPAKFSIETIKDGDSPQYKLNVVEGDFVEVTSLEDKPKQKIQVQLGDIMTVQEANGKAVDYQLVKAEQGHIVKNNGGPLLVTTLDGDKKQQQTNVSKKQVLAVQENDITLYDDVEKFAVAMRSKDISQTFTLTAPKEEVIINPEITTETGIVQEDQITEGITELTEEDILLAQEVEVDEEVSNQIGSLFSDSESIITPKQNDTMRASLNKNFLMSEFKQLYIGIQQGESKSLSIAYNSLEKRVSELYGVFNLDYKSQSAGNVQSNLAGLKTAVNTFKSTVSSQYSMPPKYLDSLIKLSNRLGYLAGQKMGSDVEKAVENWEKLTESLPSNLIMY